MLGRRRGSPRSGTVLFKVCDVGLASLVCKGVDIAPPRRDEPEVPAAVFPLDKGAHGVLEEAVTRSAVSWALVLDELRASGRWSTGTDADTLDWREEDPLLLYPRGDLRDINRGNGVSPARANLDLEALASCLNFWFWRLAVKLETQRANKCQTSRTESRVVSDRGIKRGAGYSNH